MTVYADPHDLMPLAEGSALDCCRALLFHLSAPDRAALLRDARRQRPADRLPNLEARRAAEGLPELRLYDPDRPRERRRIGGEMWSLDDVIELTDKAGNATG